MKLNNTIKNILSKIRSRTGITIMVVVLAVLAISASATQLIAPTENKPSTLIKKLFQPDSNLTTDSDTDKKSSEDQTSTTQAEPEPATENLPPASTLPSNSTSQIPLVPLRAASLFKTEYTQDPGQCTSKPLVSYSTISDTSIEYDKLGSMDIVKRLDATANTKDQEQLRFFDSFLNKTDTTSPVQLFSAGCGGFYSGYLYDLTIKYPGTDNVRVAVFQEGQDTLTQATVRIYATKGSNIIQLRKSVIPYSADKAFYVSLLESCSTGSGQNAKFDADCYKKELSSPTFKAKAQSTAQEIVEAFVL